MKCVGFAGAGFACFMLRASSLVLDVSSGFVFRVRVSGLGFQLHTGVPRS